MKDRLSNLISVKSIVTILLTIAFVYLCCIGSVKPNEFLTVYTVVIAFYFGTQASKKE